MTELKSFCAFGRLLEIMAILRAPGGCPWDAAQTPDTLKRFLLEETYETLEALDSGETSAICEELGDLLLQIVFHARIYEERGEFGMSDVAAAITEKLIRRHPHVFGTTTEHNLEMLDAQWDRIKREEKRKRGKSEPALDDIPAALPALLRARKAIEKTNRSGRESPEDTKHLQIFLRRFEQALSSEDINRIQESLGILLFSLVREAAKAQVDAEESLRRTVVQFVASPPSRTDPLDGNS